ncbi:polyketide synthase [Pedobacter aquatilis]|uniref:polyketide synthase n=1 Tax=Pedobacter aquatilis TaxID=351343 RepID=UPI00292DD691|nr:polyketide synthase [Pedobacter aquatilis]
MTKESTIVDIFNKQAKFTPNNIAVTFDNNSLTYEELDSRANQLANFLKSKGVGADTMIPVLLNRSLEMIISLIGILKAGAAYVPIDPEYPVDRIMYIISDSKAKLLIADSSSEHLLKNHESIEVVIIDSNSKQLWNQSKEQPELKIEPSNLAYIIYTSGSTGKPKGVMIEHRNVVRLFFTDTPLFDFSENDVWTMFHSFCFDFSVWEMYGALLYGGRLVIVPKSTAQNASLFRELMVQEKVTVLNQTPSAFNILQEEILSKPTPQLNLHYVIFGGEALNPSKLKSWKDTYPDCKVINMYGITETTVHVTYIEITAEHCKSSTSVVGAPIPTLYAYVLDNEGNKCLPGVEGELYIGGAGLARGYLNLPELTASKFITDKFSNQAGSRLYRTGDLAKILSDDSFEYLGRIDDQVKINGFRIELGEIEATINRFLAIEDSVVLAKENTFGEKRLIAYVKANDINQQALISFLHEKLPDYMVPRIYIKIQNIPLTSNGKTDRKALSKLKIERPSLASIYKSPKTQSEKNIASVWKNVLEIDKIGIDDNFFELGGNSLLAQSTINLLKHLFDYTIPVTKLYKHPTLSELGRFLDHNLQKRTKVNRNVNPQLNHDIAIIGMAGRFPGANTIKEFWQNLIDGKETITFFSDAELDPSISEELRKDPNYIKARGVVNGATAFEPSFFGINSKLAELMDPQQRIFLEISWEVLESTGHLPNVYNGKIGVYAGAGTNTYYENNVLSHKDLIDKQGKIQVLSVNDKDYIASRTAYHLNLKGPAVSINSACSTSLLAIAEGVTSLRAHTCDVAVCGGASITSPINSGHYYQEGSMLSNDGHCNPFDDSATGTVFSDGAGVVLLKRLRDAQENNDTILAVIKGIGLNNDGFGKGSFTAPSSEGQADAISSAIENAGVDASAISYIEAHGTGTPIGDPIEFEGLVDAFGEQPINQYCALGSVKSNFGHLTHAAGVAGLIKVCLSLYHQKIPASLGFKKPNRSIDFENSPFYINTALQDWKSPGKRLAGVSSFGVGGTNVHVILEEYQNETKPVIKSTSPNLITWSARSEESLKLYGATLSSYLKTATEATVSDIGYSLSKSRAEFSHRKFVVAESLPDLISKLENDPAENSNTLKETPGEIVFTFPGQGAQYLNMGLDLYKNSAIYRNAIDECATILKEYLPGDIRQVIFSEDISQEANDRLRDTRWTQPALFVTEYALARLWLSYGITPTLLCGHSIGEYVAAHLAGVFSLKDGLKLVASRGLLISKLPVGSMLSVRAGLDLIEPLLTGDLCIAAINSKKLIVISGPTEQISEFSKLLDAKEIANKPLYTSHAFHSSMMDPILDDFRKIVEEVKFAKPSLQIISTVTGNQLSDDEAQNPDYWTLHLRKTVHFAKAIDHILTYTSPLFLEVGPGAVTSTLTKQIALMSGVKIKSFISLNPNQEDYSSILNTLGQLWINGAEPDLQPCYQESSNFISTLPGYQFNRKKFWVDIIDRDQPESLEVANSNAIAQKTKINTQTMRKDNLTTKVKQVLEDASGIEMNEISLNSNFIEIGLDSLLLTQVAISLKKEFNLPITFRKLNEEYPSIEKLVSYLDQNTPQDEISQEVLNVAQPVSVQPGFNSYPSGNYPISNHNYIPNNDSALGLIAQQLEILSKQVILMQGSTSSHTSPVPSSTPQPAPTMPTKTVAPDADLSLEEKAEIQKPFGATPKIERLTTELNQEQQLFLKNLTERYNQKTIKSKEYTAKSRSFMADPRVVTGFRPLTKELVYPIVINKSSGCKMWDLDGNEYIDVLNGFGSNMLGYQPEVIKEAMHSQIEKGYEVGPQHELAAEVSKLICEFTGFERAALCSTGSEAVLGCIRIARTVTGRSLIVAFTGSYHGIVDEVLVRGTKKLKSFPAAAGIMAEAVQNILVLDYGTDESLAIIKERANEIAAVLVEPIQSRRPEFVPVEFLKKLRKVTADSGAVLVFDEVITGFRMHPGGAQALFGIKADLASYGKVVGAGIPIGVIAGDARLMDALDGGNWNFGDHSFPEIGVTYFAGTFVRHPLALASAKASLLYMRSRGPKLQEDLNAKGKYLSDALNAEFEKRQLPIFVANYGSLWKIKFNEEIPFSELLFVLMREKGIHILDGFPCFITEATTYEDIEIVLAAFRSSIVEMIDAGIFPGLNQLNKAFDKSAIIFDNANPPVKGAKLGKDEDGNPAWFVNNPDISGEFLKVVIN